MPRRKAVLIAAPDGWIAAIVARPLVCCAMAEQQFVIGVDVGTQSAKVLIFAASGEVVAHGQHSLRPLEIPSPNRAIHPNDDLWDGTVSAFRAAVAAFTAAGYDTAAIAAMGVCVIRCCRVLLRADGSLAHPVINWMDERLDHPHAHEQQYGEVSHITTSSGYVGLRLTGERVDTCANLIGWWPIDDLTLDWSDDPERWETCRLSRDQVFDLVQPGEQIGGLIASVAAELGLPEGLPVIATAHDKAVEALGSGVLDPGVGLVSLGTYIAAMATGEAHIADAESFWSFQAAIPGRYLYECWGVRRGMWSVSWFRDQFGAGATEDELNSEAAGVSPGSDGLLTVHDWAAPPHAPFRKGAIVGFDGRHTRAHVYRSILEGIALRLKNHMDPMADELGQPFTGLVVSGGGANADVMMQILADVHGVPVSRNRLRSSAAIGCAVNAGMFAGVWSSSVEAADRLVQRDDTFEPIARNTERYARLAAIEAGLHEHLDPITEAISALER
ncbi:MAG: FGGY-family carbohydrate kinase [Acidimicrobiales bacterium]|nr:FGGY-family carbohydrate kinase [Acidimicrobiales bacterium]MDG1876427.1 FGGY-family carbohydrate kinase [Acidimicrobiales bacterium]